MDSKAVFTRARYTDQIAKLEEACAWLAVEQGRAAVYGRLLREFFEDGLRTKEHILGYNESCEIVDLFEVWHTHVDQFPGLESALRRVCKKGPVLCEGENPGQSTNRPRNDGFGYLVAGTLIAAGVAVVAVDGIQRFGSTRSSDADLTFEWNDAVVDVECKRPKGADALIPRMQEARKQIERPERGGRLGVVALDCSRSVRPAGELLEYGSGEDGERKIAGILTSVVSPQLVPHLSSQLLGFMLVARVPSMMRLGESPILSAQGRPFQTLRPESILSWLVVANSDGGRLGILRDVTERVRTYQRRRRGPA
jgi:hypothetical protein